MAPFGFSRPTFGKKKSSVREDTVLYEEPSNNVYSLNNDENEYSHHGHVTTQVPTKQPSRWKSVLKRKQTHPVVEVISHDGQFLEEEGPYRSNSLGSSSRSGARDLHRTNTGNSHRSIQPYDSASNIHISHAQPIGRPFLHGIVEEQSDGGSYRGHSRSGSPIAVIPEGEIVSTHEIGRGMRLHQGAPREGHRMAPLEVTDAHGRRQQVKEIILDGSGTQEIPMPADGNVIFIVEEGVTLEVKDPDSDEFIPLEEYYRRLAERPPPKQERQLVVNGDASNLIVEDVDGTVIYRGDRVTSEYMHNRHERHPEHRASHHRGSHISEAAYEQHIVDRQGNQITIHNDHENPQLRLFMIDPTRPGVVKPHYDHLVITTPPRTAQPQLWTMPGPYSAPSSNSSGSSHSSTRRRREERRGGDHEPVVITVEGERTPRALDNVYLSAIPERSHESLPRRKKLSTSSRRTAENGPIVEQIRRSGSGHDERISRGSGGGVAFREDTSIIPGSSDNNFTDNNFLTVESANARHSGGHHSNHNRIPSPAAPPTILLAGEEPAESPVIVKKGGKALKNAKKAGGKKTGRDRSPEVEQVVLADESPLPPIPGHDTGFSNREFTDESDAWAEPPQPPRHRPMDLALAEEAVNLESPPESPAFVTSKKGKKAREDEKKAKEKEKRNTARRGAELEEVPSFRFQNEAPLVERVPTPPGGRASPKPSLASRIIRKLSPSPTRQQRSLSPVRDPYAPPLLDDPYAFEAPRHQAGEDYFGSFGNQPLDLGIPSVHHAQIDEGGRQSQASGVYEDAVMDPLGSPATLRARDGGGEDLLGDLASTNDPEPEPAQEDGWFSRAPKKGNKKTDKAATGTPDEGAKGGKKGGKKKK